MNKEIETFSILAGSEACNARCPFCISKMTPPNGMSLTEPEVNWRNFRKACAYAKNGRAATAMITGKGEPTLYPDQITKYLAVLDEYTFPIIELQTNGIMFAQKPEMYKPYLQNWYDLGLTTIALSIVHFDKEMNRQVYLPYKQSYIDLPALIDHLHKQKFSVRLATVGLDGFIDSSQKLAKLVDFARTNGVEQLTYRPVNKPEQKPVVEEPKVEGKNIINLLGSTEEVAAPGPDLSTYSWTDTHHIKPEQLADIKEYVSREGRLLLRLPYGAAVFDLHGQNLCLTNCLTTDENSPSIRQLIFFPDGHVRYDWQYSGAILF